MGIKINYEQIVCVLRNMCEDYCLCLVECVKFVIFKINESSFCEVFVCLYHGL